MKDLREIVLKCLVDGHGYDKMSATPPSRNEQLSMAEAELDGRSHNDFLWRLSYALAAGAI